MLEGADGTEYFVSNNGSWWHRISPRQIVRYPETPDELDAYGATLCGVGPRRWGNPWLSWNHVSTQKPDRKWQLCERCRQQRD